MKSLNAFDAFNAIATSRLMRGVLYVTVAAFTIPELIWTGMYLITVF